MKLRALSHYDKDMDTRFGDCILIYGSNTLIVYDCGHTKHAEYVESFLQANSSITAVYIVVSHNDSDHTSGICDLLDWLSTHIKYTVKVSTHQYLKYVDDILAIVDDGRRTRESVKQALLAEFDNIREIIETAQSYNFEAVEALRGTSVGNCEVVGPTAEEFTAVAAKAIDNRESDKIGEGHAEETVMNAASVQLKCTLDNGKSILLCGDASPDYLKDLSTYDIIQLPHHGQEDDALAIFAALDHDERYLKAYLISDNTGSAQNSGGSDDLVAYMKKEKYSAAYNTQSGVIDLPKYSATTHSQPPERRILGDLDSIKRSH